MPVDVSVCVLLCVLAEPQTRMWLPALSGLAHRVCCGMGAVGERALLARVRSDDIGGSCSLRGVGGALGCYARPLSLQGDRQSAGWLCGAPSL